MKFKLTIIGYLIGIILIIVGIICVIALKVFIIGSIMKVDRPTILSINVDDTHIYLKGDFYRDSALAYKNYSYRIKETSVYIRIYSVVVSDFYKYGKFDIKIFGNFKDVKNIYLEDDKNNELIWTR